MAGKFNSHVLVPNVYNLVITRKHLSNLDVMVRETAEQMILIKEAHARV